MQICEPAPTFVLPTLNPGQEDVDPNDQAALEAFMAHGADAPQQLSLADLILSKLREKQRESGVAVVPA